MPPDEQAQAFLARQKAFFASRPKIPIGERTAADFRATSAALRFARPAPKKPVNEIFERDIPVAGGQIKARFYRHGTARPSKALLYYHGGGWVVGDLDHSDEVCRWLAISSGYLVINVDYRLAPEHKFPTPPEDSYAAFEWTLSHAEELGLDSSSIAVSGSSAGGNLVAALCLMAKDRGTQMPAALVMICPVVDDSYSSPSFKEFSVGYVGTPEETRWYADQYLAHPRDAANAYAYPMKAKSLAGFPPTLVITAECDTLRDDGERFAARLKEEGVPVEQSRYAGALHAFFSSPHVFDTGAAAVGEVAEFLKKRFGPA